MGQTAGAMELFLVGAGHVGLVTAVGFARLGHLVTVADIDEARISGLRAGRAPVYEPGLEEALRACSADGRLHFTTDMAPPSSAGTAFICVGTPATPQGSLAMEQVTAVVAALLRVMEPDQTIVVRSTLPLEGPDALLALATREDNRPSVVVNPEFMREGTALRDFETPSRVVVGWLERDDESAARRVAELYSPLGAPSVVTDARSAALIKIGSNVLLATKVAFANEVARLADAIGADAATVTSGIGLDPRLGAAFLRPGPGIGGSCLPEQAVVLAAAAEARRMEAPLLDGVSRSNAAHQRAIVGEVDRLLGGDGVRGRRVALLGLAFKADTDDVRHSPALALAGLLRASGATVVGYDPRAGQSARRADAALLVEDAIVDAVRDADAVVIVTEWAAFATLKWTELASVMRGRLVYDTRRVADAAAVMTAGLRYEALGARATGSGARRDQRSAAALAPAGESKRLRPRPEPEVAHHAGGD